MSAVIPPGYYVIAWKGHEHLVAETVTNPPYTTYCGLVTHPTRPPAVRLAPEAGMHSPCRRCAHRLKAQTAPDED